MSSVPASRNRQPGSSPVRHAHLRVAPDSSTATPRHGLSALLVGIGLAILALVLGFVAKTRPVASFDLRVDEHIAAHDRASVLTALAKEATITATPETIGIGLMILLPLVLVLVGRRLDALRVFCMVGGAFALAEVGKKLIGEHRPPVSLQAMAADSGASYPSGHTTVAAVLAVAVIVVIATTAAWRYAAIVVGAGYVLAVAASRVYLADHYLLDVLGGILCALAAAFIVTGLAALPALQPFLRRLGTRGGRHRTPLPPRPAA